MPKLARAKQLGSSHRAIDCWTYRRMSPVRPSARQFLVRVSGRSIVMDVSLNHANQLAGRQGMVIESDGVLKLYREKPRSDPIDADNPNRRPIDEREH